MLVVSVCVCCCVDLLLIICFDDAFFALFCCYCFQCFWLIISIWFIQKKRLMDVKEIEREVGFAMLELLGIFVAGKTNEKEAFKFSSENRLRQVTRLSKIWLRVNTKSKTNACCFILTKWCTFWLMAMNVVVVDDDGGGCLILMLDPLLMLWIVWGYMVMMI